MAYINVDEVYILDNTGLQVDMATDIPFADAGFTDAQKEQARKNIGAGGTNPNLLDNPWFTVNQRSVSGAITNGQYGLDRWMAGGGTVTMTTGGITLGAGNSYALQRPANKEIFNGKTVTMSVMTDDGVIESGTVVAQTGAVKSVRTANFELCIGYTVYGSFYFYNTSASAKTVIAAKLELGSVSTLLNDTPPNYAEELRKCQYYYREFSATGTAAVGIAWAYSATAASFPNIFGIDNTMRVSPTVTASGSFSVQTQGGSLIAVTSVQKASDQTNSVLNVNFMVASGLTTNQPVRIIADNGAKIAFSADL